MAKSLENCRRLCWSISLDGQQVELLGGDKYDSLAFVTSGRKTQTLRAGDKDTKYEAQNQTAPQTSSVADKRENCRNALRTLQLKDASGEVQLGSEASLVGR